MPEIAGTQENSGGEWLGVAIAGNPLSHEF
jgi:hypothetical protein